MIAIENHSQLIENETHSQLNANENHSQLGDNDNHSQAIENENHSQLGWREKGGRGASLASSLTVTISHRNVA